MVEGIMATRLPAPVSVLRQSRARIVSRVNAERRRLERDLHDGAQQSLVALAARLRLAQDLVTHDPAAAAALLGQLADEVQQIIGGLRDLAHGIYPQLLADYGLASALRAVACRSELEVMVTAQGVGRYAEPVESAVYFCCLEALQNAGKHAAGARVQLALCGTPDGLTFSIIDDGPGHDLSRASSGDGYLNMADRLAVVGGTVRWHSLPGHGMQVLGMVPTAVPVAAAR
jgi:signal transduction histidine kinase